jgi:hypothetical protein
MGIGAAIQLAIAILTAIPSLVQAAEALHDQAGAGPAKKAFVVDAITKLVAVAKAADGKIAKALNPQIEQSLTTAASGAIDSAVTAMNAAAATPPPAA